MRFNTAVARSGVDAEQDAVQELLRALGETPDRPGVVDTPRRVVGAWKELTRGTISDLDNVVGNGVFDMEQLEEGHPGVVALRDIPFSCLSAETLLPIYGKCHVAYEIQKKRILGLSKIARLAKAISRGIQTQQDFTDAMVEAIAEKSGSNRILVTAAAKHIYYDRPLRVISTRSTSTGLVNGSEDYQDLEALLPSMPPTKTIVTEEVTCSDLSTLDRIQNSLRTLTTVTRIVLPSQDAVLEYGRQLYHATVGLRETHAAEVPAIPMQCDSDDENNAQKNQRSGSCVVDFVSTCEHHILPFHGRIFVGCAAVDQTGFVADLTQLVGDFVASQSRRLQVQERLTNQIADFVLGEFPSASVVVLCEAYHLCMIARGPEVHQTATRTICKRGVVPPELLSLGRVAMETTRE